MLLHFAFLLFAARCAAGQPLDPSIDCCRLLANAEKPTYDLVSNCYKSFPYNEKLFNHTMTQNFKALELYVYLDTDQHPLISDLEDIRENTTFLFDFEWQSRIRDAFITQKDAHLVFESNCFNLITFNQPFFIASFYKTPADPGFFVAGLSKTATEKDKAFLGAEIKFFDDETPESTFPLSLHGMYKVPNAIYNGVGTSALFSGKDGTPKWQLVPGAFSTRNWLPERRSVKYKFVDGRTYEREWDIDLPKNKPFKDKADYWNKFCVNDRVNLKSKVFNGVFAIYGPLKPSKFADTNADPKDREVKLKTAVMESAVTTVELNKNVDIVLANATALFNRTKVPFEVIDPKANSFFEPVQRPPRFFTENQALYSLKSHSTIGIWDISDIMLTDICKWHLNCAQMFEKIAANGIKRIILDLSGNSGGNSCFTTVLAQALMRNSQRVTSQEHTKSARISELFKLLTRTAEKQHLTNFDTANYLNPNTRKSHAAEELLTPRQRSEDITSDFTQPFVDVCPAYDDSPLSRLLILRS